MARVSVYLNFQNQTEEAFNFYKTVFGTEFEGGINRFGDMPTGSDTPPMPDEVKNLVLHVSLPVTGGFMLMGSDAPEQMGFKVNMGNNIYINLEPDTREETTSLFNALSAGGAVEMPLADMFWGAFFGSCTDKFGVKWMFNCSAK
jgi:PhnB protein